MSKKIKSEQLKKITNLIHSFCDENLNNELEHYAVNLCNELDSRQEINITRGKIEIWAASIIYAIARLNFLFDRENEYYISTDTVCDYFGTKKTTIGNKATQIEKICDIHNDIEKYCRQDIIDSFTFYETKEGLIIPKNMMNDFEIVYEIADEEETETIEKFMEEKRQIEKQKLIDKKNRRAEINKKIAEKKRMKKEKDDPQLDLFNPGFSEK
ncbi:MAG: hypothetical protein H8D87_21790 [Deltaproteobacteria bacterium]|nr:hypothetical protein [Candidatus Desulfobacula maris]